MVIDKITAFLNSQASVSTAGFLIIIVSIIAVYYQRKTARQKLTIEYLQKLNGDKELTTAKQILATIHHDPDSSIELVATSKEQADIKDKILPLLNYFESLAIGVKISIYDKKIVRLSRRQQITTTFEHSEPYIKAIRKKLNNDLLFINLERLANNFKTI